MGVKVPIQQTPPSTNGVPNPLFYENSYDELIQLKGYDVIKESAVLCPCRSQNGGGQLTNCQNCGGSGWVFINPIKTRMVLQSMNFNTKYKEWSKENIGTVTVTARKVDQLSFMDRLTVVDSESIYQQLIFPKLETTFNKLFAWTLYPILSVIEVFKFTDEITALTKLTENTDYTVDENKIVMADSYIGQTLSLSIRYKCNIQYHVLDLTHETRNTRGVNTAGQDKVNIQPFTAIARRSHYVLDPENYQGIRIINNSYQLDPTQEGRVNRGLDYDFLDRNIELT